MSIHLVISILAQYCLRAALFSQEPGFSQQWHYLGIRCSQTIASSLYDQEKLLNPLSISNVCSSYKSFCLFHLQCHAWGLLNDLLAQIYSRPELQVTHLV